MIESDDKPDTDSSYGDVAAYSYRSFAVGYASSGTVCGGENEDVVGVFPDFVDIVDATNLQSDTFIEGRSSSYLENRYARDSRLILH